jgi:hypothetical protein
MVDTLRMPFFVLALVLVIVVVALDAGAAGFVKGGVADFNAVLAQADPEIAEEVADLDDDERAELNGELNALGASGKPPGLGIPYMALVDGVALFTVGLMGAGLVIRERLQARVQGCATLIFSVLLLLACIGLIFAAITKLLVMIALFLAAPFGTLTYLALYGFFPRGGAAAILALLLALKLGFGASLLAAQQRFLQNTGLVLIVLTGIVANVIVSFLHGLPPGILVSITDAVAAIVNGILAAIWAIVLLIGSLPAIGKALNLGRT